MGNNIAVDELFEKAKELQSAIEPNLEKLKGGRFSPIFERDGVRILEGHKARIGALTTKLEKGEISKDEGQKELQRLERDVTRILGNLEAKAFLSTADNPPTPPAEPLSQEAEAPQDTVPKEDTGAQDRRPASPDGVDKAAQVFGDILPIAALGFNLPNKSDGTGNAHMWHRGILDTRSPGRFETNAGANFVGVRGREEAFGREWYYSLTGHRGQEPTASVVTPVYNNGRQSFSAGVGLDGSRFAPSFILTDYTRRELGRGSLSSENSLWFMPTGHGHQFGGEGEVAWESSRFNEDRTVEVNNRVAGRYSLEDGRLGLDELGFRQTTRRVTHADPTNSRDTYQVYHWGVVSNPDLHPDGKYDPTFEAGIGTDFRNGRVSGRAGVQVNVAHTGRVGFSGEAVLSERRGRRETGIGAFFGGLAKDVFGVPFKVTIKGLGSLKGVLGIFSRKL